MPFSTVQNASQIHQSGCAVCRHSQVSAKARLGETGREDAWILAQSNLKHPEILCHWEEDHHRNVRALVSLACLPPLRYSRNLTSKVDQSAGKQRFVSGLDLGHKCNGSAVKHASTLTWPSSLSFFVQVHSRITENRPPRLASDYASKACTVWARPATVE